MLINEEDFVVAAAKTGKETIVKTQKIHTAIEETLFKMLASVKPENTKDNPIVIKIFKGVYFKAYYVPEKNKKPNYSEKEITIAPHIKIKVEVTKYYHKKIETLF